jgi:hypothetical protein
LRKSRNLKFLVTKSSSTKISGNFQRKRRSGEKTYDTCPLFLGVRGIVSRNRLDMIVASFPGYACPLQRSEGDVFTRIQDFLWNRIVRVNPLPRGTSVGESGKNLSPSKRRIYRIRKYICELASRWKVLFREKETLMKRS